MSPPNPATATTTLLLNGRVHSPAAPDATAMAVADGIVVWVGQDSVGRALHPDAEIIDLDGAFVAPAFVDAHVHATSAGLLYSGLDLTGCRTLRECLDLVRAYAAEHPGVLIWGHGWEEVNWAEGRPPTRAELDEAAGGAPVYLSRIDVHSALVTTALLHRAPGARDADGWSEQGPLARAAHHHVRRAAKESLTAAQRQEAQRLFLTHAASLGVAAVHECAGPDISSPEDLTDLLRLSATGDVPQVFGYWGEAGGLAVAKELGATGVAGDLFVDGALGSRTAALCEPYTDDPSTSGALYLDADAVAEHLIACTRAGVQGGFHVIGDRAVAQVVAGFAKAENVVGAAALAARHHRLEHLEMVTAEQAARLAGWGVIASMQPLFDDAWGGTDRAYAQRLGLPRGAQLNPFATVAAAGMVLAFGSDVPVTPVDPWATVRAAVYHRTEGLGISPRAAFTAHTRGGWRAAGIQDGVSGTLQPGAPATYAVWAAGELVVAAPDEKVQRWSTDPRSRVPALPRLDAGAGLPRCLRTVLRGRTIHHIEEDRR
ncbi:MULTISPECIES: amidohydrolase [unclassified Crossiella]|uniref:amidohydrolase n=1 Tax=unclassified Crossiella TaxID=2620835 RepID=UPI001FFEEE0B|nr:MULTISPECIES: amidohydrolase [unclassified Crossiella]MCK2244343.1 amidohydrolase [Crossiella sp. S99.2]MCK2257829.1 amidohydrolase [Crossiella sp. S99.1]